MPRHVSADFLKRLGNRIRARRKFLGRSRAMVACELRISPTMLTKYERGKGNPPAFTLHRLAVVLGTSSSVLMGEDMRPDQSDVDKAMELMAVPAIGSVVRHMALLPDVDRKNLHAIACTFSARQAWKEPIEEAPVMTVSEEPRAAQPVE